MKAFISKVLGILLLLLLFMTFAYVTVNIFFPNATVGISSAMEDTIYRVSNFRIDLNGDGQYGSADRSQYGGSSDENVSDILDQGKVEGFSDK